MNKLTNESNNEYIDRLKNEISSLNNKILLKQIISDEVNNFFNNFNLENNSHNSLENSILLLGEKLAHQKIAITKLKKISKKTKKIIDSNRILKDNNDILLQFIDKFIKLPPMSHDDKMQYIKSTLTKNELRK